MVKSTEHCDLCEKEFNKDKNGFIAEIGYSIGGWGQREDFVRNQSFDVCDSCFDLLREESVRFNNLIKSLKKNP